MTTRYGLSFDGDIMVAGGYLDSGEEPNADDLWTYRDALAVRRQYPADDRPALVAFTIQ